MDGSAAENNNIIKGEFWKPGALVILSPWPRAGLRPDGLVARQAGGAIGVCTFVRDLFGI